MRVRAAQTLKLSEPGTFHRMLWLYRGHHSFVVTTGVLLNRQGVAETEPDLNIHHFSASLTTHGGRQPRLRGKCFDRLSHGPVPRGQCALLPTNGAVILRHNAHATTSVTVQEAEDPKSNDGGRIG